MQKFRKIILYFLITTTVVIAKQDAWACTTFNLQGGGFNLVGHNYDWPLENGLLIVKNPGSEGQAFGCPSNDLSLAASVSGPAPAI